MIYLVLAFVLCCVVGFVWARTSGKTCPECRERIDKRASVCPHCEHRFPA